MPLPLPKKNEKQKAFVARCMNDSITKKEHPDTKQRVAVCFSQWRKSQKSEKWEREKRKYFSAKLIDALSQKTSSARVSRKGKKEPIMKDAKQFRHAFGFGLSEAFRSLHAEMRSALENQVSFFNVEIVDFSSKEVIFAEYGEGGTTYYKASYNVKRGLITIKQDTIKKVDRVTTYEKIGFDEFRKLTEIEKNLVLSE